jgi:hypothetical protein
MHIYVTANYNDDVKQDFYLNRCAVCDELRTTYNTTNATTKGLFSWKRSISTYFAIKVTTSEQVFDWRRDNQRWLRTPQPRCNIHLTTYLLQNTF